jgi:hypothetical protein
VEKVVHAIPDILEQAGAIVAFQEQDKTRIFIRFELPLP